MSSQGRETPSQRLVWAALYFSGGSARETEGSTARYLSVG